MSETSAKAPLQKSAGVTATERMLADFCERSVVKNGEEIAELVSVVFVRVRIAPKL
jgi:hypothetical protein